MRIPAVLVMLCVVTLSGFSSTPEESVVQAARNQDKARLSALLDKHQAVDAPQGDGATALHWAAHWDDAEMAGMLLRAGANPNAANDFGVTPLALACANANPPMVRMLLAAGADPNAAASTGETPLMTAVRTGNVEIVKALLAKDANVNGSENARQQTALMWAVARQYPEIVRLLVEHGADLKARSRIVNEYAIRDRGAAKRHPPVDTIAGGGSTPLLFAARLGALECGRILLDAGANVNDTAPDGTSALVLAAYSGHGEFARLLLDRGADPNAAGAGYTALHIAVLMGDADLAKALLAHGANPNARLTKGTPVTRFGAELVIPQSLAGATPLLLAAKFTEVELMRLLLAGGSDPRLTTTDGTTLLMAVAGPESRVKVRKVSGPHLAGDAQLLEAVRIALDAGADVNATNQDGDSAAKIAQAKKHPEIVELLTGR